jgi:hypothetical protein
MAHVPQKHSPQKKSPSSSPKSGGKSFFSLPEKKTSAWVAPDINVRLGGVPLETKAGFSLISYRLRRLLAGDADAWAEIDREEHGSFVSLFIKYHLPLLIPFFFLFVCRELLHFSSITSFLRHTVIVLPMATAIYAGYIFLTGVIAEETAEYSGGRFSPQSGMRIAIFSSLILSCFSVGIFLPIIGMPLTVFALFWHYRQLMHGARTLLNLSDANYRLYRFSHLLVWLFLGLTAFLGLSIVSFIFAKLGLAAI